MSRIAAALLIVFTFPIVLAFALLIKWQYPGPMFYRQTREGKNGQPFEILKLRTMVTNANLLLEQMLQNDPVLAASWAATGVLKNDPRIAGKLGRLARQLSIDELPQLVNVIKGEMAFVGPRPLEIPSVEALPPATRKMRHSVLPGITGLMQVKFRAASIRQMMFYDRIYVHHKSFGLDFFILCQTVTAILKRTGA
ncbi:sugar transferase [Flavobacterium sp.]|uniref:sugar transferase n=1 Tax=Flavobacterium sp. TaxID=239 RepID=UPI0039E554A0